MPYNADMSVSVIPTLQLEHSLAESGADVIISFDEVGRGALAGPVMVGASAIWARDVENLNVPEGVADSKMLTPHKREQIVQSLKDWCAAWAVGSASNKEIDTYGISAALGMAALRAIAQVEEHMIAQAAGAPRARDGWQPELPMDWNPQLTFAGILDGPYDYITKAANAIDAPATPAPVHITTKVKADQSCATVACAAVIAKVTRDNIMERLATQERYAPYAWDHNKGYGSAAHKQAIREFGPSDLHRTSWHLQ